MADVERLSKRIVLIDKGTIIYDGPIERIKAQYGTHRTLVVTFEQAVQAPELPGTELLSVEGNTARLRFDRERTRADHLVREVADRYAVHDLSIEEPDLESIIRRIYIEGYDAREGNASLEV